MCSADSEYLKSGVAMPNAAISDVLSRLRQALTVTRCIGMAGDHLVNSHEDDCEEHIDLPAAVMAVADLLKEIYDTLDQAHGNAQHIRDVRVPLAAAKVAA
jgi:hypothetical protein